MPPRPERADLTRGPVSGRAPLPSSEESRSVLATAATFFLAFFVSLVLLTAPAGVERGRRSAGGLPVRSLALRAKLRTDEGSSVHRGSLSLPLPRLPLPAPRVRNSKDSAPSASLIPAAKAVTTPLPSDGAVQEEIPPPTPFLQAAERILEELGASEARFHRGPGRRCWTVELPTWLNLRFLRNRLSLELTKSVDGLNANQERLGPEERLIVSPLAFAPWTFVMQKDRAASRVALIVDDVGFHAPCVDEFVALHCPVTLSVFPFYPSSERAAETAHHSGLEIMLHMPMEPKGSLKDFQVDSGILTRLTDQEILGRLKAAIDAVPHCIGMNNHMGSLATEDRRAMRLTMDCLRNRDLFFVDSVTSLETLGFAIAKSHGVRAALRNAKFLDNSSVPRALNRAFTRLLGRSRRQPETLAILHDRPNSVKALKDALDALRRESVELCFASELVR